LQFHDNDNLPINDFIRDDTLLKVTHTNPWNANIMNFIVIGYVPPRENRKKLLYQSRTHLWDDPYLYLVCANGLHRKCVPLEEATKIIERYHSAEYGGHYGAFRTNAKIW